MLRKRLITALTFNDGVLFRTRNFRPDYRYTANFIDAWSIDEIVAIDITRPEQGNRNNFYKVIDILAKKCFVPLAAGGGIRDIEEVKKLLNAGADKVIVNTQAVNNPGFINEIAKLYGAQCVVVSIDAKQNDAGEYEVYSDFGTKNTQLSPQKWAKEAQKMGAGEIFLTSIDKDGTLEGYDNKLNQLVSQAVNIPVLVCGGAGKWQDFVDGFLQGEASAVCTTNIYHFTETSIKSAKKFLAENNIVVRV